jgi:hypothetical protein
MSRYCLQQQRQHLKRRNKSDLKIDGIDFFVPYSDFKLIYHAKF